MNSSDSGSRRPRVVIVGAGFGGLSAAKQQGRYVAKLLLARAAGKMTPPFRYRDFGSMATIGRKRAVVQIGCLRISGLAAWLLWSLAHIYFLIGFAIVWRSPSTGPGTILPSRAAPD
jgi:NADH dehydrogenase FAD-containing subunit